MHFINIREKLLFGLFKFIPLKKNMVLFKSFGGQYGDNPKYISEKLHEMNPELMLVWAVSDKSSRSDFPQYVTRVEINSIKYIYYCSVSKTLVDNMSGIRGIRNNKSRRVYNFFLTRKGQMNVSTWHGTPLKRIGCDVIGDKISNYQTSANFITVGNRYSFNIFKHAFNGIDIKMYGSPRNDILLKKNIDINQIKDKLGLPKNKKILLYAPTFRNEIDNSGVKQIQEINLQYLFKVLNQKFGGDWVLVLRVHHEVLAQIHKICSDYVDDTWVFDGNLHDDMAEYLVCTDVLLTDYSSSLFDFMLVDKPCFLMAFDRQNYVYDERGIYFPIEELPFSFSDTVEQLYRNILNYDFDETTSNVRKFLDKIENYDDGNSAERIANLILKYQNR